MASSRGPRSPSRGGSARAGTRIGPYVVTGTLGRGGMGVVLRARHEQLGREVALKLLRAAASPTAVARLQREARTIARLDHPGIVTVHEVGTTAEGAPFVAMELVDGEDLGVLIEAGRLPLRARLEAIAGAARALHFAHEQGVIHRDVKPQNIVVSPAGQAKLLDFGLGKMVDGEEWTRLTATGAVLGTPAYMAPEQVRAGRTVDARTDVYALGATLYHAVAGVPPLDDGLEPAAALFAVVNREAPSASSRASTGTFAAGRPPRPAALDAICARALAKDPARRHPSALAFARDLEAALAGRPVAEPTRPRPRPRRVAAVTAVAAVALVTGAVSVFLVARGSTSGAGAASARTIEPSLVAAVAQRMAAPRAAGDIERWVEVYRLMEVGPDIAALEVALAEIDDPAASAVILAAAELDRAARVDRAGVLRARARREVVERAAERAAALPARPGPRIEQVADLALLLGESAFDADPKLAYDLFDEPPMPAGLVQQEEFDLWSAVLRIWQRESLDAFTSTISARLLLAELVRDDPPPPRPSHPPLDELLADRAALAALVEQRLADVADSPGPAELARRTRASAERLRRAGEELLGSSARLRLHGSSVGWALRAAPRDRFVGCPAGLLCLPPDAPTRREAFLAGRFGLSLPAAFARFDAFAIELAGDAPGGLAVSLSRSGGADVAHAVVDGGVRFATGALAVADLDALLRPASSHREVTARRLELLASGDDELVLRIDGDEPRRLSVGKVRDLDLRITLRPGARVDHVLLGTRRP